MGTRKLQHQGSHGKIRGDAARHDHEPQLRTYPVDSPQAAARVLALALLADGSIHLAELSTLARRGILARLGISATAFDDVIHELCVDLLIDRTAASSGYLILGRDALRRIFGDIDDPALQRKLLRAVLAIVHADGELAGGEAVLLSVAAEAWDIDPFDSYRILASPGRRWPPQVRRIRRAPGTPE